VVPDDALMHRLARSTGLRTAEVRAFVRLRLVTLDEGPVRPVVLRRLRRARRLRRDLGLSMDAVAIVVRLLDRIEALERGRPPGAGVRIVDEPS
jgi:MerR HTH family regulatory protein